MAVMPAKRLVRFSTLIIGKKKKRPRGFLTRDSRRGKTGHRGPLAKAGRLAGGQRHRLKLAQVLAADPANDAHGKVHDRTAADLLQELFNLLQGGDLISAHL